MNYTLNPTTFVEATLGRSLASSRRAAASTGATAPTSARPVSGQPDCQPAHHRAGRAADPVPRREHRRSQLLPVRGPERSESGELRRHPGAPAAERSSGAAGSPQPELAPPNTVYPGFADYSRGQGLRRSASPRSRAGTRSRPATTTHSHKRQNQGDPSRHAQLRQRRQQPARLRVRVCQCRARHLQLLQAGVEVRRGAVSSTPTTRPTSRTTGR